MKAFFLVKHWQQIKNCIRRLFFRV